MKKILSVCLLVLLYMAVSAQSTSYNAYTGAVPLANGTSITPDTVKFASLPGPCINGFKKALSLTDDDYRLIQLPFSYTFGDSSYNQVYISNNGVISFGSGIWSFSPSAMPVQGLPPMIAPLWCDVDTRLPLTGDTIHNSVWYKLYPDRMVVIWDSVAAFPYNAANNNAKLNKMQVMIGDNSSPKGTARYGYDLAMTIDTVMWAYGTASSGMYPQVGWVDNTGSYMNMPGTQTSSLLTPPYQHKTYTFNLNQHTLQAKQPHRATPHYPSSAFFMAGHPIQPILPYDTAHVTRYKGVVTFAGTAGTNPVVTDTLNRPVALATDYLNNLYIDDRGSKRLLKISTTYFPSYTSYATTVVDTFSKNAGIAVDPGINIFRIDTTNSQITKRNPAGIKVCTYGTISGYNYAQPAGMVIDTSGNVYVANTNKNRIDFSTSSGNATTVSMGYMNPIYAGSSAGTAGMANGPAATATFNHPTGVAVDAAGSLFVADWGNNQIRKITTSGTVSLFAGNTAGTAGSANGTGSAASFNHPYALCIDTFGNLYVTDQGNNKVRRITPAGVVTTIAGSGAIGYKDTAVATAATFHGLGGIAIDDEGTLYIADTGNNAIRALSTIAAGTPATKYISGNLPAGLHIDSTTGVISGTPITPTYLTTAIVFAYNGSTVTTINIQMGVGFTANGPIPSPVCSGDSTQLMLFYAGGNVSYVSWKDSSSNTAIGTGITKKVGPAVTTTYSATVPAYTTFYGDSVFTTDYCTIPVNARATITTDLPAAITACTGNPLVLNVVAANATAYTWQKGGSTISGATGNTYIQSSIGTSAAGTYRVITSNTAGCNDTSVSIVSVSNMANTLPSATATATFQHTDGLVYNYTDASCERIATVSDAAGGNIPGAVNAKVTIDTAVQTYHNLPYLKRHYDIAPASNGPAIITLYATQADFNAYNSWITSHNNYFPKLPTDSADAAGIANINIRQFHGLPTAGTTGPAGQYDATLAAVIPNSAITINWNGNYWALTFPVSGFSGFFIGSGGNVPLAVTLTGVWATNAGRRNHIEWHTATEEAGDYFEIERSLDAAIFTQTGGLAAKYPKGGSYTFTDEAPAIGVNYYRIRTTGINGTVQYSKVVSATVAQGSFVVEAYPNPVTDKITVRITGTPGSHAAANIFDAVGRLISSTSLTGTETVIPMDGISPGLYLLEYRDDIQSYHIKIRKQ